MTEQERIKEALIGANWAIEKMDKGIEEALEYIKQTRALIEAVHVMVNDVERAAACRCSHAETCSTCKVWLAHDAYEKWLMGADMGVDSPPAVG